MSASFYPKRKVLSGNRRPTWKNWIAACLKDIDGNANPLPENPRGI
jgi:hypothetical protein